MAATLNVSKPAITRALDRLQIHGFIRRLADPNDGRSIHATLTPEGEMFLESLKGDTAVEIRKAA